MYKRQRQNIGVHLRGNLRPNELAKDLPGQIRHAGFVLVLAVKLEGTAPVHGQGIGFLIHSNRALVETVVSVVITQTLHIQVRNQHVPRAYKFRSHGVIGQEACFRFLYQNFIQLPGQFTKVKLLLDVLERAVVVPKKALIIEKGGAYVFVVRRDSIVEKRFVETGPETGNNFIVERGLASYENIVVEGYHKLTHGMKVEPVAPREEEANPEEE